MEKNKKLPKRLRKYRMNAGFTIYTLADRLGVNHTTVSNWENGKKHPRPDKMMELEDMFNVGYRELFKDLTEEETLELERRRYKQHNE
ncbi:helix-turn-helix transcriptional regulator [Bacillus cereus]|nr:helix-turn-helix transcriptional regulator [Bacillus cereus]